jgi:MFS family permease
MDRRYVLLIACAIIVGAGTAAMFSSFSHLYLLMFVFMVFGGSVETVYSIGNAHANDRADPGDFVPLSSTLLVAWSTAATIVPLAVTMLTPILGGRTFIVAAMAVAVAYAAFVVLRLKERGPAPEADRESFEVRSAQLPNAAVLTEPEAVKPGA